MDERTARTKEIYEDLEDLVLQGSVQHFVSALDRHSYEFNAPSDIPEAPRLIDVALLIIVEAGLVKNGFRPDHHPVMINACLERGANINCHTQDGPNLLACAIIEGADELVRCLVGKGAHLGLASRSDVEDSEWFRTPLMVALAMGESRYLDVLLPGSDLNLTDESGWTALHYAVSRGVVEGVKALIEHGASLVAEDDTGLQPLSHAPWMDKPQQASQIMHLFLDAGVDPHGVEIVELSHRQAFDACLAQWEAQAIEGATPPARSSSYRRV